MPPGGDYVTRDIFDERTAWLRKGQEQLEVAFKELRNDVLGDVRGLRSEIGETTGELRADIGGVNGKLDALLDIGRREERGRMANRKALIGLLAKVFGTGGAGAGVFYIIQKLLEK